MSIRPARNGSLGNRKRQFDTELPLRSTGVSGTGEGEPVHLRALFGDVDLHTLLRMASIFGIDAEALARAYRGARGAQRRTRPILGAGQPMNLPAQPNFRAIRPSGPSTAATTWWRSPLESIPPA